MDSVFRGERGRFQTGRRMSQDISALHATLAARAGRHKPFSHVLQKSQSLVSQVPEFIVGEGQSQRQPAEPSSAHDVFTAALHEHLIGLKDGNGKTLYTAQQILAQLGNSQVCSIDRNDKSFGETGGITYFGRSDQGMEHSHTKIPVSSLTVNSSGYEEMDQKWASLAVSAQPAFRWVHLPANKMEWVDHAVSQILTHYMSPEDEEDPVSALISPAALENQILRAELWEGQQNVGAPELPHARFMRPFCRQINATVSLSQSKLGRKLSRHDSISNSPSLDNPVQEALGNSMVLFMPFIHWETTLAYLHMKHVIKDVDTGGIGVFGGPDIAGLPCGIDEKLLRHHLQRLQPMHVRRTLDQFGYYTMADTTSRDKDQVVDRYSRVHHTADVIVPPMLMVDQCWLWVIGSNTVLTCFPHRWNKSSHSDSTDVYESILEMLDDPLHRNKVQNAGQLAALIIDRCAGNILDRHLIKDEHLRFLDFFDWSIDDLNERQSQCLQDLWQDMQDSRYGGDADGLTDISKEFDVLEKIKDIIDELQIILRLIDQQHDAFNMVLHDARSKNTPVAENHSDGTTTPINQLNATPIAKLTEYIDFQQLQCNTLERADGVKAMIARANATYKATLDVLSLKQQQANISEARSSRKAAQEMEKMAKEAKKSAEESEKQSYSIMLFTVVTIFFLPMSAIASIFGVNAIEFGQGQMHLSTIFAYIFPISIFVVYVSFFLAFNHKARRSLLLCMHIFRAYINLALPVVFDEQKESGLQKKLEQLKQRRHAQRDRKIAMNKIEEAALKNRGSNKTEVNTEAGAEQEKEDNDSSALGFALSQRERSRFNSIAGMNVFGWRKNRGNEQHDPEARPAPSTMSSYGPNVNGETGT